MKAVLIAVIMVLTSCVNNPNRKKLNERETTHRIIETKLMRGGRIWSLDWSPDGKYIACGNATGLLRIYDTETFSLCKVLTGFKHTINGLHWDPTSTKIVASGSAEEPVIIIWDLRNYSRKIIESHNTQIRSVRWSPGGKYFASSSHDGTIKIWSPEGKFIRKFEGANGGCVGIDWLNEDKLAASCWDNTIRIYSISGKDSLLIENGSHRRKAVLSVDWHPNGQLLATGDYGNEEDSLHVVKLWTAQGTLIRGMSSHQKEIRTLSWNSDGSILATGGETVRLWDIKGNLLTVFEPETSPVWSLDWNKSGSKIASGHNDGKIRVWNSSGELVDTLDGHSGEVNLHAFSNDSSMAAVGFSDGEIRFYNLIQQTSQTIAHHLKGINDISWNHSKNRIAFSSNDGTGSIWEIRKNELILLGEINGKSNGLQCIEWSPDDTEIATGSNNSQVYVWDSNGNFKYSITYPVKNVKNLVWENGQPVPVPGKEYHDDEVKKIYLKWGQQLVELIPLNNNRFALMTKKGNLIHGDKNDFVRLVKIKEGFMKVKKRIY